MKIGKLMTPNPRTLHPDDQVLDCLDLIEEYRFHHIPVVDSDGEVVGMVSSKDFDNYLSITRIITGGKENPILVKDIMTTPIFSYYEDVPVHDAARAMVDNNINCVVVMNKEDKMIGIVTSTDLLRYLSELNV